MRGLFAFLDFPVRLLSVQQILQLVQRPMQILVGAAQLVDLADRVHHCSVMLVAELPADFR